MSMLAAIGPIVIAGMQIVQGFAQSAAHEANAAAARAAGSHDVYKLKRKQEPLTSTQQALYAKCGVRLEGSPLEVIADSYAQYELDIAITKYNTEALVSRYKSAAFASRFGGFIKAGTTLLSASGDLFPKTTTTTTTTKKAGISLAGKTPLLKDYGTMKG